MILTHIHPTSDTYYITLPHAICLGLANSTAYTVLWGGWWWSRVSCQRICETGTEKQNHEQGHFWGHHSHKQFASSKVGHLFVCSEHPVSVLRVAAQKARALADSHLNFTRIDSKLSTQCRHPNVVRPLRLMSVALVFQVWPRCCAVPVQYFFWTLIYADQGLNCNSAMM